MENERFGDPKGAGPSIGPRELVRRGNPPASFAVAVALVFSFLGLLDASRPRAAWAQQAAEDFMPGASGFVPADRSVVLLLDRARQLQEAGRYAEAVQCLDRILRNPEDYFFKPEGDASVHRSIKSEARQILGAMPPSGRESYELQFGALARDSLETAVETADISLLAEVARRLFHTEAGYEATFLLGMHHMDHGRPLVAALTLRRLQNESTNPGRFEPALSLAMTSCWLAAGMADEADQALEDLRGRLGGQSVTIAGREVSLAEARDEGVRQLLVAEGPESSVGLADSSDWTVHGGSPRRIAVREGGRPLMTPRWYVPATDYPAVESMIEDLRNQQEEREVPLIPGLQPLVVNGVVLTRTTSNLLAVDLETGKRIWEVPAEDPFEMALNPHPEGHANPQPNLESGLRLRLWGDGAFGTLASDGKLVFAVEDLQLPSSAIYSRVLLAPGNRRSPSRTLMTYNRLAAFELGSQGRLRWELGGPHSENPLPLAGAFFLGPPLPLQGDLYVLAELEGEIRLLALNAQKGDLLWQQQLAVVEQSVYQDTLRRVSGVSPSYADGVLVCPTSNHSIVALDLTTRSLLWGYSYAEAEREDRRMPNFLGATRQRNADPEDRWIHSSLVIADGRVLATPTDSDQLHCLSLHNGEVLWRVPREDQLYVAAVHEGKVVTATRRGLTALSLEHGKPAWKNVVAACPDDGAPSGQGFNNGSTYYLPLTGGRIMAVDLATGEVKRTFTSRRGHTLGNLVCHDGKIISQRADGLECYYQLDALRAEVDRRLAADPDDARALALQGEILWEQGKLQAAVERLRKSVRLADSVHTRTLLREALFEGLERDFAQYEASREEIQALIETAAGRAKFHRLLAAGSEDAARYAEALAQYRRLFELDSENGGYVNLEEGYRLRQDRWIRSRLNRLVENAPAGPREALLQWAEEALAAAQKANGPDELGRLLNYFAGLPGTAKHQKEHIDRLLDARRPAEAEIALMARLRSAQAGKQAEVFERWASLLVESKRFGDAASLLAEIEARWPNVSFSDETDGRQWAAAFAERHEAIGKAREPVRWPEGYVKTTAEKTEGQPLLPHYGRALIPAQNRTGLFFRELTIEQQQDIVARNGFGQIEWQFPLADVTGADRAGRSRTWTRFDACGHLLIVSLGDQVVALDTLATEDDGTPTVAWVQSIDEVDTRALQQRLSRARFQNRRAWIGASGLVGPAAYSIGAARVLGDSLICIKRSRTCVALDPATGEIIWEREGFSAQSQVFGDDRYVLIASGQSPQARVLRAEDGTELEPCKIPPEDQWLATFGRKILCRRPQGREVLLEMVDPMESENGRTVWGPYSFSSQAKYQVLDQEAIGVFDPEGKFQLIGLSDGRMIVDTGIEAEKSATDAIVLRSAGSYVLVVNNAASRRNPRRHASPLSGVPSRRIGKARVYGFDSNGTALWEKPTVIEGQALPLNQPRNVPCLTFACTVHETVPGRPGRAKVEVRCLDTRSGAIVARREFQTTTHTLEIAANPEKSELNIRMQQEMLTLTFTDEPIPESAGLEDDALDPPSNVFDAIWRALQDGATGLDETPKGAGAAEKQHPEETKVRKAEAPAEAEREAAPARLPQAPPPLEPAVRDQIESEQPRPNRR